MSNKWNGSHQRLWNQKKRQEKQRVSSNQTHVYKFSLLYRRSRDGNTVAKFRELCNNKGPTIAIGRVSDTEEVLGGYNPIAWGLKEDYIINTEESFIFALNKDRLEESIVSVVVNAQRAIWDYEARFPVFGNQYRCDLHFNDDRTLQPYAIKNVYQVPIRRSSANFKWADWEVFSVSKP